jgi:hypothetical protein
MRVWVSGSGQWRLCVENSVRTAEIFGKPGATEGEADTQTRISSPIDGELLSVLCRAAVICHDC